jgi:hypothetical protein
LRGGVGVQFSSLGRSSSCKMGRALRWVAAAAALATAPGYKYTLTHSTPSTNTAQSAVALSEVSALCRSL